MAGIFEPGKATSTTTQPATPARREAVLAILQALGGRSIGGYGGKRGKAPLKLDLGSLIKMIQSNPDALTKTVMQTGRPSSPSTFQNLAGGATTAALLAKVLMDGGKGGNSMGGSAIDFLSKILGLGDQGDAPDGSGFGMWPQDMGGESDFDFGGGSSDGTYGVNQSDAGMSIDDFLAFLGE